MRAVLFGVGETARALAAYAADKGIEIVGTFSRTTGVGQDAGLVLGLDGPLGHPVSADPAADLPGIPADVAILATQSTVTSQLDLINCSLRHGLDVLSLAEEGFHPVAPQPAWVEEVDGLAKRAGRTVFFGGVQDAFWYQLPSALTAGAQRIDSIVGHSVADLDDLGAGTLREYPLGLTEEEFGRALGADTAPESLLAVLPALSAVAAGLGVTLGSAECRVTPVLATTQTTSRCLGTTFPVGTTRGISERVSAPTDAGFTLEMVFSSLVLQPGESQLIAWELNGEPDLRLEVRDFPGEEVTAASLINRIPAVIDADPGYRSAADLPGPRWWAGASREVRA